MDTSQPSRLSDRELLARLGELVEQSNRDMACLLQHLAEVDRRRLYLEEACSSLFKYCVSRLGFSEAATFNRITAARLGQRYPAVFELITTGKLHLAAVRLLAPHVTDENHLDLLKAAHGKSKRELEVLLAERFPKPDAPTVVRKLPTSSSPRGRREGSDGPAGSEGPPNNTAGANSRGGSPRPSHLPPCQTTKPPQRRDRLMPLAPARYKVQFTASADLVKKIDEARELASHHVQSNDLAMLFEKALDLFIASEQKRRFAATKKPRRPRQQAETPSRRVPAEVRRAVWRRDEGRCTYVDEQGQRCGERHHLEFDHEVPHAQGGPPSVDNIRLLCRAHNQQSARATYGTAYVDDRVRAARATRRKRPSTLAEPIPKLQIRVASWRKQDRSGTGPTTLLERQQSVRPELQARDVQHRSVEYLMRSARDCRP